MSECIFCSVAQGDVPSQPVLENEEFLAIRDIAPKADVHLLVLPRAHHENLDSWVAAGGDSNALLKFVSEVAAHEQIDGRYRLIANVGPEAGQEVFHLHLHLLSGGHLSGF